MRDDARRGSGRDPKDVDDSKRSTDERAIDPRRESGLPGGGEGRRDEVGPTGVFPMSAGIPGGNTSRFGHRQVGDKAIAARRAMRILADQSFHGETGSSWEV